MDRFEKKERFKSKGIVNIFSFLLFPLSSLLSPLSSLSAYLSGRHRQFDAIQLFDDIQLTHVSAEFTTQNHFDLR